MTQTETDSRIVEEFRDAYTRHDYPAMTGILAALVRLFVEKTVDQKWLRRTSQHILDIWK